MEQSALESRDKATKALKAFFKGRQEIILAYLFGSYLKRTSRGFQDVDIAVYADPASVSALDRELPYGYRGFLSAELGGVLRYRFIDLTLLDQATPLLLREVIRSGKLIFCRSEEERIRFEIHALKKFADTEHLRRIKRQYMRERIQEGPGAYEPGRRR